MKEIFIGVVVFILTAIIAFVFKDYLGGKVTQDYKNQYELLITEHKKLIKEVKEEKDRLNELLAQESSLPIGTIIAWHRDIKDTIDLKNIWVPCNGQKITDKDSPIKGFEVPNLNNGKYNDKKGIFLRGGSKSGLFNESTSFGAVGQYGHPNGPDPRFGAWALKVYNSENSKDRSLLFSGMSERVHIQVASMTVVWIIKIK